MRWCEEKSWCGVVPFRVGMGTVFVQGVYIRLGTRRGRVDRGEITANVISEW